MPLKNSFSGFWACVPKHPLTNSQRGWTCFRSRRVCPSWLLRSTTRRAPCRLRQCNVSAGNPVKRHRNRKSRSLVFLYGGFAVLLYREISHGNSSWNRSPRFHAALAHRPESLARELPRPSGRGCVHAVRVYRRLNESGQRVPCELRRIQEAELRNSATQCRPRAQPQGVGRKTGRRSFPPAVGFLAAWRGRQGLRHFQRRARHGQARRLRARRRGNNPLRESVSAGYDP